MCAVSAVGDHYHQKWKELVPNSPFNPGQFPAPNYPVWQHPVSREEFNQLKKEVEEMKKILQIAVQYDKMTNQPHCEQEEKIATLKKIADLVGVDLSEVFK